MTCFEPIKAILTTDVNPSGVIKKSVRVLPKTALFSEDNPFIPGPIDCSLDPTSAITSSRMFLDCGRCIGCKYRKSLEWKIRCVHESGSHERNSFLTLTYRPKDLPKHGSLVSSHVQNFLKRLRYHIGCKVRYFYCGEYGSVNLRPHYHMILFGYDFFDKVLFKQSKCSSGDLFISPLLSSLWPYGFSSVGSVTSKSVGYCARYSFKKIHGTEAQEKHYGMKEPIEYDCITKILVQSKLVSDRSIRYRNLKRCPEYVQVSRRPGLANAWIEQYYTDVYPCDYVVLDGLKYRPPRYYDRWLAQNVPEMWKEVYQKRIDFAQNTDIVSPRALKAKRDILEAKLLRLKREL